MDITQCRRALLGKGTSPEAEDWLIEQVCRREQFNPTGALCRNFLLDDFSRPFLESLSRHLYGEGYGEIMGPYYEFISAEGGDARIPYYKVYCFKRKRDSMLRSYLSTITARHFTKQRARELARERSHVSMDASDKIKTNFWECDLKENEWFALLLSEDSYREVATDEEELRSRLHEAIGRLPEKERKVIQLTVLDDASGLEAFEELAPYLKSKKSQDAMSDLEKQRAVAVLKRRAIDHLAKLMKK